MNFNEIIINKFYEYKIWSNFIRDKIEEKHFNVFNCFSNCRKTLVFEVALAAKHDYVLNGYNSVELCFLITLLK